MVIATADQHGFTLPDRDYYLIGDYKAERNDYRACHPHVPAARR
jgi:predicted metalloendopeptidase